MLATPTLRRLRQEDTKLEDSLDHVATPRLPNQVKSSNRTKNILFDQTKPDQLMETRLLVPGFVLHSCTQELFGTI